MRFILLRRRCLWASLTVCLLGGSLFLLPTEVYPKEPQAVQEGQGVVLKNIVKNVSILYLESFPLKVQVQVRGELPDLCTGINPVTVQKKGSTFFIIIPISRPADAACAQIAVPFRENIPLDIYGLKAGEYLINVNGVEKKLRLDLDNMLPEENY